MEIILIALIPMMLFLLGAGFLVVAQVSGFMQSTFFNQRQNFSNMVIQQYMERITLAQGQLFQRKRELEEMSEKLSLSNQELSRLNDMKSKFLSMVVHDVRTPLASIRGFSELMTKRVGAKEAAYLKNIVSSTDQLGRLISDLTDLAMIEAGKLKMEKSVFNFPELAMDVLPGLLINAQKKGVELLLHELPDGVMVEGDKFRLSQVFMNLVNNAIKFTPAGKRVEISFKREGRNIDVLVKDSGIGIHPSETKKIFEKFYQAKYQKDEKLRKQGWGLGLSIAQEIVHSHKGEIGANSPGLGKGSTFWFKIPVGV
ncbi:MAG: HAMP domain-containing sensor histidine kinase [Elusimicrobiales bacterium]|nr:HAMP domain-containing sensor histidine kinase [Elusimicrobiales bacterium]